MLASGYGAILVSHASHSVGGSDSSGYFNSARALATGRPVQPIEPLARFGFPPEDMHLFIPLGYVPGPRPGTMVTFYPVGLPLQMLPAAAILGWDAGPFLVAPLFAASCIVLVYLLARELGASRSAALVASAALACSPILTFMGVQLMSDAPAAAWALLAILCGVRARRRSAWAALAGAAFGMGVLLRPASALLLLPLLFALPARRDAWFLFGAGGAPFAALFFAFNRIAYGGVFETGYAEGGALSDFRVSNVPERFRHYLRWISAMMTPLVPAGWLAFAVDRLRPLRDRLMLLSWFAGFFVFYCFYGPYETWWYTRYLLPAIPGLLIAAVLLSEDLLRFFRKQAAASSDASRARRSQRIAVAAAILAAAAVCGAGLRLSRRFDLLKTGRGQATFPETIRWAAARVPPRSVVLAMEFSGAMRAYDWGTFVRWDYVEAGRFPELRRRFEAQGYRLYALMQPHEVTEAAPRLPGDWKYLGSYRDVSLWRLD